MEIALAGSGRLAQAIARHLEATPDFVPVAWPPPPSSRARIVVHAGSGRELPAIWEHCSRHGSLLVELSTGTPTATTDLDFPRLVCANTSLLLVKFLHLMRASGKDFAQFPKTIRESHQSEKTSVPGTALDLARAFGVPPSEIESIRDPRYQVEILGIPTEHLGRHAWHRIELTDGDVSVRFETRVLGVATYAKGALEILRAVAHRPLEARVWDVTELVEHGWL